MLFYYFCVMIGLNIIVAFSIDMYSSIDRLDRQQKEHENKLFEIAKDIKQSRDSDYKRSNI